MKLQFDSLKTKTLTVMVLLLSFTTSFAQSSLTVKRELSISDFSSSREVIVTVEVSQKNIGEIARLVESIPAGLVASELSSSGGKFVFEQNEVKVVWMKVPKTEVFRVKYKLVAKGEIKEKYSIVGKFHYVSNKKKKMSVVAESTIFGEKQEVAVDSSDETETNSDDSMENTDDTSENNSASIEDATDAPEGENTATDDSTVEDKTTKDDASNNDVIDKSDDSNEDTTSSDDSTNNDNSDTTDEVNTDTSNDDSTDAASDASDNSGDKTDDSSIDSKVDDKVDAVDNKPVDDAVERVSTIVYKVQLGAFSTQKNNSVFNGLPNITYVKIGNVYKYYTGEFKTREEANVHTKKARSSGFSGAFVVKFENGERAK